jgi:hypothetical protein
LAIVLLNLITVLQTQKMLKQRKCECDGTKQDIQ